MTTFEWHPAPRGGEYNCIYSTNTAELSRSYGVAGVYYIAAKDHYVVSLSHYFNQLVPSTAYILKHKYPTLEAAKRAVERKLPGLIAVLKMQGTTI